MVENVVRELEGVWLAVSSENIDNYLIALGVGKCERQKISDSKIWQKIHVVDDIIHLEMCCFGSRQIKMDFRLNETFEIKAGKCSRARACWVHGCLVIECVRVDSGLKQTIKRRRSGQHLIQTMIHNDVSCTRTYIRAEDADLMT